MVKLNATETIPQQGAKERKVVGKKKTSEDRGDQHWCEILSGVGKTLIKNGINGSNHTQGREGVG